MIPTPIQNGFDQSPEETDQEGSSQPSDILADTIWVLAASIRITILAVISRERRTMIVNLNDAISSVVERLDQIGARL
jgi:hypothetical protein